MKRAKKSTPVAMPVSSSDLAALQARLNDRFQAIEEQLTTSPPNIVGFEQVAEPIRRIGRELVDAAVYRAHGDPDRAVALVNAYVALVATDRRARA